MRGNWTQSPTARAGTFRHRPSFDSLDVNRILDGVVEPKVPTPAQCQPTLLVDVASACVGLSCVVLAAVYVCIGAYVTSVFPFLTVLLSGLGVAYMHICQQPQLAATALCVEVCLCSLAVNWSSAGQSSNVLNWAMMAPGLLVVLGGPAVVSGGLMLLAGSTVCVFHALHGVLDPLDLTPEKVIVGYRWVLTLSCLNTVLPWLTGFLTLLLMRQQPPIAGWVGEERYSKVKDLARQLAEFNVDGISSMDERDSSIVGLLKQVAANIQRMRPFVPADVLQGGMSQSLGTGTQSAGIDPVLLEATQFTGHLTGTSGVDLVSSGFERTAPMCAETCPMVAELGDLPAHCQRGTLLYVKLHDFAAFAEDAGELKAPLIPKISLTFQEVIQRVAAEWQGVVREVSHDCSLLSWHASGGDSHAQDACQAARAIAQQLRVVIGKRDTAAGRHSIGVWTGPLPIGGFNAEEVRRSGLLGRGVGRVQDLQHYAAVHRRGIVANAEVRQAVPDTPTLRLLPVDVAALRPVSSLPVVTQDGKKETPAAELLYEVLEVQPMREQEWMYEMQARTHTTTASDALERLLWQLHSGPPYGDTFDEDLRRVVASEDRAVRHVAEHIRALGERASAPYCVQPLHTWCPLSLIPGDPPPPDVQPPRPTPALRTTPSLFGTGPTPFHPDPSSSSIAVFPNPLIACRNPCRVLHQASSVPPAEFPPMA